MEIVEIITYHINELDEVLEVSFRTNTDDEDYHREDKIPFYEIDDFGYEFHKNNDDDDDDLDDVFETFDYDLIIDEDEILSFLNDYYVLFIDKLPNAELI